MPNNQGAASANVGQTIEIRELTGQRFNATEQVQFQTVTGGSSGVHSETAVTGTAGLGLQTLVATVPSDADAQQVVRVPGYGSAKLQIVPTISSITMPSGGTHAIIQGSGFVCGGTNVLTRNGIVPAAQVTSVTGAVILVEGNAIAGLQVFVRTAGGTSESVQA
jgi:hypothetical protein